jgi:hypothetical protein
MHLLIAMLHADSCMCREDGKPDGPPQSAEEIIKESIPGGWQANPAAQRKPTDTKLTPQQLQEVGALELLPR